MNLKNKKIMISTTSLKHYKELKAKGIAVKLVVKQDLKNKGNGKKKW